MQKREQPNQLRRRMLPNPKSKHRCAEVKKVGSQDPTFFFGHLCSLVLAYFVFNYEEFVLNTYPLNKTFFECHKKT